MRTMLALLLLCIQAQAASITLNWDGVTNATAYRLFQSVGTAPFAWLNTYSGLQATVDVATNAVTRFYVTSFDATGKYAESKPSNVYTNTPAVGPPPQLPAPTNLRAVPVQGKRWDLSWSSSLLASTEVERSIFHEPFERIETVAPGTLHTTTTINKKTDYAFRFRSVTPSTQSPYSTTLVVYQR